MSKVTITIPDLHAYSIADLDFAIRMLQKEKERRYDKND